MDTADAWLGCAARTASQDLSTIVVLFATIFEWVLTKVFGATVFAWNTSPNLPDGNISRVAIPTLTVNVFVSAASKPKVFPYDGSVVLWYLWVVASFTLLHVKANDVASIVILLPAFLSPLAVADTKVCADVSLATPTSTVNVFVATLEIVNHLL